MAEDYTDENERRFYEFVRQHLVSFLLLLVKLIILAFVKCIFIAALE